MALKKRQHEILLTLMSLGGEATTRQIAELTGLNVNGVAQSLGALSEYVRCLGGRAGETKWELKNLRKPEMILHHDDPPCTARIENGYCPKCKLTPDMQSTCLHPYCRICHIPLKNTKCPQCGQKYRNSGN